MKLKVFDLLGKDFDLRKKFAG